MFPIESVASTCSQTTRSSADPVGIMWPALALTTEAWRTTVPPGATSLTVLDFGDVAVIDFSCADEVVAKLVLRAVDGVSDEADHFFLFRGVAQHHVDPMDSALRRRGLAAAALGPEGEPFLMGEVPLILDDLTRFELDVLALEGVDPDTIPTAEEVAVDGRLQGRAVFSGGLERFSGEGTLSVQDLRYRTDYLQGGTLTFSARDLPGDTRRIEGQLRADSLRIRDLSLRGGEVEGEVGKADGRMRVIANRREGEEYRARGTFAFDSLGGRVDLDELDLRFDTVRWNLGGPTSFAWGPTWMP